MGRLLTLLFALVSLVSSQTATIFDAYIQDFHAPNSKVGVTTLGTAAPVTYADLTNANEVVFVIEVVSSGSAAISVDLSAFTATNCDTDHPDATWRTLRVRCAPVNDEDITLAWTANAIWVTDNTNGVVAGSITVERDTVAPILTLTSAEPTVITSGAHTGIYHDSSSLTFTFTGTEDNYPTTIATDLLAAGLITNCPTSTVASTLGIGTFTVLIACTGYNDGDIVTAAIHGCTFEDDAGNCNTVSGVWSLAVNIVSTTPTYTVSVGTTTTSIPNGTPVWVNTDDFSFLFDMGSQGKTVFTPSASFPAQCTASSMYYQHLATCSANDGDTIVIDIGTGAGAEASITTLSGLAAAAGTFTINVDTTAPVIAITATATGHTSSTLASGATLDDTATDITFTFTVTETNPSTTDVLTLPDANALNCAGGTWTEVTPGAQYTLLCPLATTLVGTVGVSVNYCAITDLASNCNQQYLSYSVSKGTSDTTDPVVSGPTVTDWTINPAVQTTCNAAGDNCYTNDSPVVFTFAVDEDFAFGASPITAITRTNCNNMQVTSGWRQFYVSCVPTAQGAVDISVDNFISDLAVPANTEDDAVTGYVMYDTVKPTVTATYTLSGNTITFDIDYSEADKPADSSIVVSGATCVAPTLSATIGDTFDCTFEEGATITLNIAANSYCDLASNCNDQFHLTVTEADATNPTVSSITAFDYSNSDSALSNGDFTNDSPIVFTYYTSENIATVDLSSFDTNCGAATSSVGYQNVVVRCFPANSASQSIVASVPDGMFMDAAGNSVTGETDSLTVIYDNTLPDITITASSPSGTSVTTTVTYTFTLTETNPDTTYDLEDVFWLSNCIETAPRTVTPTSVQVVCDPVGFEGITSATVAAHSYRDLAGNGNEPGSIYYFTWGSFTGVSGAIVHASVAQGSDFEQTTIQTIIDQIAQSMDVDSESVSITDIEDGMVYFIVSGLCADDDDSCVESAVDSLRLVSQREPVVRRRENIVEVSSSSTQENDDNEEKNWIGILLIVLTVSVVILSVIVVTMLCRSSNGHRSAPTSVQMVHAVPQSRSCVKQSNYAP